MGSASTSRARWPASCTRSIKLGAFFDIIHQDPILSQVKLIAEPWDLGDGGYQVGNFPGAVDRVERQVPRLRPPVLEGRRRRGRPSSPRASRAAATSTHRAAAGRTPASTSSPPRRLHAARPGQLQREAQRGQRRRQPRRRERQHQLELRRRRPDRRRRRSRELRERQKRNFLATLLLSQGVPMISPATSSATRSRATTTPTARTTSSPGSTGT